MFDATDVKTSVAASSSKNESELPIREVCCCSLARRAKSGNTLTSQVQNCRFKKNSDAPEPKVEKKWEHVLMKVQNRKRTPDGKMAYTVTASNMLTGEKKPLIIATPLIDEPNMPGLEQILK